MKYLSLILVVVSVTFISCEKGSLDPEGIPQWLEERIAQDEAIIDSDPQSGLAITAWIRYTYDKHYYFENYNPLSSSFPPVYNWDGEILMIRDIMPDYYSDKDSEKYIWRGSSYFLD